LLLLLLLLALGALSVYRPVSVLVFEDARAGVGAVPAALERLGAGGCGFDAIGVESLDGSLGEVLVYATTGFATREGFLVGIGGAGLRETG
jgi:hypothetical protein